MDHSRRIITCVMAIITLWMLLPTMSFGGGARKPPTITVALFQAPASEALITLIPEFERESGVKVNVEILAYADLKAKVEQQFFAKTGNYDVIMADCIWIPSFAVAGHLARLDTAAWEPGKYDFADLLPTLDDYLGRYPKDGIRYGMPFMSNTHMMAYHPEIVEPVVQALGMKLPGETPETAWSWADYKKVADAISIKAKKEKKDVYGTSLQARAGAWLVYEWYSELFGFVADQNARRTGLPAFGENATEAMQYYADLYKDAPKEALTWGHEEETSAISSGECAMDATSNVELAANLLKPGSDGVPSTIRFAYPPVGVSGRGSPDMGGYGLLLTSYSNDQRNASAFVLWAASKDIHRRVVMNGGSPIRKSEITDKEVLSKYPYLRFYDLLIRDSVYRARIPSWPELQDVISRELTKVMTGEESAKDATASVKSWVNSNIK